MSTQRFLLTTLLVLALLTPGAAASLDRSAAHVPAEPQNDTSLAPSDQHEAPTNYPWQPNTSVYAYQPDCTDQLYPDIASDDAQNLYAIWYDLRDGGSAVYFAYRPHGGAWSANVRVSDLIGAVAGPPKIAVTAGGAAHVVWQDNRNGNPDIYSSYRLADGSWAAGRRVNGDSGAAAQHDPAIGVDDAGTVWVVWTDERNGDEDVYVTSGSAAGGWGQEMRLNDDAGTAAQITPDLAVDGAGNVDVVWADGRNSDDHDIYTARRPVGGVWSANVLLAAHDSAYNLGLYDPIIATNRSGFTYFGYAQDYPWSGNGTYIRGLRRPPGEEWNEQLAWYTASGWQRLMDVTVDGDGLGYVAARRTPMWRSGNDSVAVYRCDAAFSAECWPATGASDAVSSSAMAAIVAGVTGNVHLLWLRSNSRWPDTNNRGADVYYRDGASEHLLINDDLCSSPWPTGPSLATAATGTAFALWEDQQLGDADVKFAYRQASGAWSTPVTVDDDSGHADQVAPALAVNAAGDAYAAWTDWRNNANGVYFAYRPAGGSWSVNENVGSCGWGLQFNPDIAVDDTGRVYLVWDWELVGYSDHGSCYSERALTGVWSTPTEITGSWHGAPAIAANPTGDTLLIYRGYRSGSGECLYARPGDVMLFCGVYWSGRVFDGAVDVSGSRYAAGIVRSDQQAYQILFTYQPAGGAWSTPEAIADALSVRPDSVSIAADAAGNVYAAWSAGDVYFRYRPAGGSWGETFTINDDAGSATQWAAKLAVDPAGNAYALWLDRRNPTTYLYFSYASHDDIVNAGNPQWVWHQEAEDAQRTGSMQRGTDSGGASACYYVHDPVAYSGSTVTFNVTVPYDDSYYLWARVMGLDWDQNSFTVFVDNTEVRQFEIRPVDGQWTWGWHPVTAEIAGSPVVQRFPLTAGSHTIRFQSREANTRLDAVVLVNRSGYTPTLFTPCGATSTATPPNTPTATATATSTPTATFTPTYTPTATATPTATPVVHYRYLPLIMRR